MKTAIHIAQIMCFNKRDLFIPLVYLMGPLAQQLRQGTVTEGGRSATVLARNLQLWLMVTSDVNHLENNPTKSYVLALHPDEELTLTFDIKTIET